MKSSLLPLLALAGMSVPTHTQVLIDGNLIGEVHHGSGTGGPEPVYDYLDWDQARPQ